MASTDAQPIPRKNIAYRHYFAIRNNTGALITTWAGQDSERSLDGASFADATNEATEIGTSGCGFIDLTAAEMNTDATILKVSVTNADALDYVVTFLTDKNPAGPGAIQETINILVDGVAVAGVDVWVSTDLSGNNVIAGTLATDAFGNVTFLLDAGTYYVWVQKAGYNFASPNSFTVS